MAVTVGTVPVNPDGSNNPQTGWTQAHVMDALEKAFYEMGFNSGTQKNGVPIAVLFPGYDTSTSTDFNKCIQYHYDSTPWPEGNDNWGRCGGAAITATTRKTRRFYVTNSGTQSYEFAEELKPTGSVTSNIITISGYMDETIFQTGRKLTYNGQGTGIISGLNQGQVYYMRRVGDNEITLHPDATAAQNNTGIQTCSWTSISDELRFKTDSLGSNSTITINRGDYLYFYTHATTDGGDFRICDFTAGASYASDRHYHDSTNNTDSSRDVTGDGSYADPYYWDTGSLYQTENEDSDPTQIAGVGQKRLYAYGYANSVNANLKGTITVNAAYNNNNQNYNWTTYWKYTVPASGSRSELKLRIYRDDYSTNAGKVSGITIHSEATGWSDNEVFTIPGTAIGGASPANDIEFGVNTNETGSGIGDGKCSILTTNLGSGANMFQKHPDGHYGVLRLENDASKKFGVTYWGFAFAAANMYQLTIQSGSGWSYLNRLGKHFKYNSSYEGFFGCFTGDTGLDCQNGSNLHRTDYTYHNYHQYATSSGPTNYPLKIKYYKAQAPQDTNFAVVQFIQTINSIDIPFFTFNLNKGPNFGAGIWDHAEVWNGSYTTFVTGDTINGSPGTGSGNYIETRYTTPGYHYSSSGPHHEPPGASSLAREANYAYLRTPSDQYVADTRYVSNIDASNSNSYDNVYTYFRSSTYDKYTDSDSREYNYANRIGTVGVGYHKPIKGLPICNSLVPCPFYMPDDFVMIQAEITPGATVFRPGDTVTVSGSEVYTIIIADNYTNQTGLDGVANNTANGMIFAARTTG